VGAIIAKTESVAADGKYELFKTSSHFDTTAKHPDWLGRDSPSVQKLAPQSAGLGELDDYMLIGRVCDLG
jgi:uncharacterized protein